MTEMCYPCPRTPVTHVHSLYRSKPGHPVRCNWFDFVSGDADSDILGIQWSQRHRRNQSG